MKTPQNPKPTLAWPSSTFSPVGKCEKEGEDTKDSSTNSTGSKEELESAKVQTTGGSIRTSKVMAQNTPISIAGVSIYGAGFVGFPIQAEPRQTFTTLLCASNQREGQQT